MSDFITIKLDEASISALIVRLKRAAAVAHAIASQTISEKVVKPIMAQSFTEVPWDTGTLAHATFSDIREAGKGITKHRFGYGGKGDMTNPISGKLASQYMVEQHEVNMFHQNMRKWKYLEDPVNNYAPQIEAILAEELKELESLL